MLDYSWNHCIFFFLLYEILDIQDKYITLLFF